VFFFGKLEVRSGGGLHQMEPDQGQG
jgi:hypothetical protein